MLRTAPVLLVTSLLCGLAAAQTSAWHPAPTPLSTRWAAQVTPDHAWPGYPRPTLRRDAWQNLNGLWDCAITAGNASMPDRAEAQILVPFPVESSLSGVGKPLLPLQRLWYRRTFTLPTDAAWTGKNVLLHCDAVDWEAEVFVDGKRLGMHRGGYDRFSFDVTAALGKGPEHVLTIGVRDPSDAGPQPRGKQVLHSNGIWYTPSSGIWQTVWLEPVARTHTTRLRSESIDGEKVQLRIEVSSAEPGDRWKITTHQPGTGDTGSLFDAPIDAPVVLPLAAWQPGSPTCQQLTIDLVRGDETIDTVHGYVANRRLSVGKDERGVTQLLVNGAPTFQFGPLDQGFWPDGLYTPPSFEAMCADLDTIQAMGCNMLRKHVKVECEQFYHECDKRGILVWQDMPSGESQNDPATFEHELLAMIDQHRQHPSIVMWVVFNEGWGQHDTRHYVDLVRAWDPTRWIGNASGWTDQKCGDVIDLHVYPGPAMLPVEPHRASVVGEYGGLGLPVPGHTWQTKDNWGYVSFRDSSELTREYIDRIDQLRPLIAQGLSAAVYTQTTDVEVEVNGWLTYDRAIAKVDPTAAAAATRKLYQVRGSVVPEVPTSEQDAQPWRWTTSAPPAEWTATKFDDSQWPLGNGGFGTHGTPQAHIGTEWNTQDLWLRRSILIETKLRDPFFRVHHDEDCEVFVDGTQVLARRGYSTHYEYVGMGDAARQLLTPGKHTLAVHCRQTGGGQFIDVGIVDLRPK
jgi:hypothetical protein